MLEITGFFLYSKQDFDCIFRLFTKQAGIDLTKKRRVKFEEIQVWYNPNIKLTMMRDQKVVRLYALENLVPSEDLLQALNLYAQHVKEPKNIIEEAIAIEQLSIHVKNKLAVLLNRKQDELKTPSQFIDKDLTLIHIDIDRKSIQ